MIDYANRTVLLVALLAGAMGGLSPTLALGQDSVERAREQFRAGVELARQQNWLEAEAAFERAYALYPDPMIIFNLAAARAQLGDLLDARASYREFLERATEEHTSYRESAESELSSIAERIGTIEFRITGLEDGDITQVDGRAVDPRGAIEADPGERAITVQRGTATLTRTVLTLEAGGSVVAELTVVNPERVVVVERETGNGAVVAGILIGLGALLAAGGILLAVFLTQDNPAPHQGNVEPGVVTLPLAWSP